MIEDAELLLESVQAGCDLELVCLGIAMFEGLQGESS